MRVLETLIAGLFAAGGLRSLWVWARRPFEGADAGDHALYALYVTGRVGLWLAIAGLFALYASSDARGRAAIDELSQYRWYLMVPVGLAVLQMGAGYMLGRRASD